MIEMDQKEQILHYHRVDGLSLREISRRVGLNRKTVTRYIREYEASIREDPEEGLDLCLASRPKYPKRNIECTRMTEPVCAEIEYWLHVIYSEPQKYIMAENTSFSDFYFDTKQVLGYGGMHSSEMNNDILIVASGYDDQRISDIANFKKSVKRKIQILGFPPLQADMFQENIVKAYNAESALGSQCFDKMEDNIFAPAYDPFVTAQNIKEYLVEKQQKTLFTNIYFSPLSSKPLALGIALFYIWEQGHHQAMSIIYPQCKNYITENSEGIGCIWRYEFQIPPYK